MRSGNLPNDLLCATIATVLAMFYSRVRVICFYIVSSFIVSVEARVELQLELTNPYDTNCDRVSLLVVKSLQ